MHHMYSVFMTKGLQGVLATYVDDMANGTKGGFEEHVKVIRHILEWMDKA